jgi:predicted nucleic acid-binding protein
MLKNKIYLDINIVVDIIDDSRVNHSMSIEMLEALVINDYEIYISEDMLSTIYYILKDKNKALLFFKNLIFIDWNILSFGLEIMKQATDLSLEKNLDLEDTLQCLCARENGCEVLITNDKTFSDCGIKIITLEEFTVHLKNEYAKQIKAI